MQDQLQSMWDVIFLQTLPWLSSLWLLFYLIAVTSLDPSHALWIRSSAVRTPDRSRSARNRAIEDRAIADLGILVAFEYCSSASACDASSRTGSWIHRGGCSECIWWFPYLGKCLKVTWKQVTAIVLAGSCGLIRLFMPIAITRCIVETYITWE